MDDPRPEWVEHKLFLGFEMYVVDVAVELVLYKSGGSALTGSQVQEWIDGNRNWIDGVAARKVSRGEVLNSHYVRILKTDAALF
jgi:hypothetical protein